MTGTPKSQDKPKVTDESELLEIMRAIIDEYDHFVDRAESILYKSSVNVRMECRTGKEYMTFNYEFDLGASTLKGFTLLDLNDSFDFEEFQESNNEVIKRLEKLKE